jgi:site-specific recombinase XerD
MTSKKPTLLEQMRNVIRVKHYALNTERSYLPWIKRFIHFHKKHHPSSMGEREINEFLTHIAVNGNVAATTQNQAPNAIVFFYKEVLKKREEILVMFRELKDTNGFPSYSRRKKPKK